TAAAGYRFANWTGEVANATSPTTTVTMNGDKTVTANFIKTFTLTMAVTPAGSGTTVPAVGAHVYDEGTVVDISATATGDYEFDGWTGEVADAASATTTVTMDGDKTVTAKFKSSSILGDVNGDDLANSTDALIILSCDVGFDVSMFCPMNCGDVNGDGLVNSTDALIILSFDTEITVPFPIGQPGCPGEVTPCPGCN
ncbi:hypothetical protein EH222_05025, partial [candidate division KSB1 bacterium]